MPGEAMLHSCSSTAFSAETAPSTNHGSPEAGRAHRFHETQALSSDEASFLLPSLKISQVLDKKIVSLKKYLSQP